MTRAEGTADRTHLALSGVQLFPIGFGLGAIAALALFFGYRAVTPEDALPVSTAANPSVASAASPAAAREDAPFENATPAQDSPGIALSIDGISDTDSTARNDMATNASPDTTSYAAADADVAAAEPTFAGLEELASLSDTGSTGPSEREALPGGSSDLASGTALPSIEDPATSDLFGGQVMMVSSAVPRVIMLADGTSLVPGERLPGGHRIVDIRRERILLERDGIEWRVRIP